MGDALAIAVTVIFQILWWAILIRVLLSWLPMAGVRIDPYNPIIRALHSVTEPILEPIRKFTTVGMMDLSPIVALIGLSFLERILVSILTTGGF